MFHSYTYWQFVFFLLSLAMSILLLFSEYQLFASLIFFFILLFLTNWFLLFLIFFSFLFWIYLFFFVWVSELAAWILNLRLFSSLCPYKFLYLNCFSAVLQSLAYCIFIVIKCTFSSFLWDFIFDLWLI
jgi:hypothetical protein